MGAYIAVRYNVIVHSHSSRLNINAKRVLLVRSSPGLVSGPGGRGACPWHPGAECQEEAAADGRACSGRGADSVHLLSE